MSTIIVGVEGSSQSDDAVVLGRRLAHALRTDLLLVAAYPYEEFDGAHARPEYEAYVRLQAEETLEHHQAAAADVAVRARSFPSFSPARALFEIAVEEEVAAIVVGATHHAVRSHVALGSVAERLLSGAPCPVGVAPLGYEGGRWSAFDTIGVAFTPTAAGRAAAEFAASIARGSRATLALLSVADPRVWRPDADAGRATDAELSSAQREVGQRHLDEAAATLECGARTELLVGDPTEQLLAASESLDLLVCGSRDYGPVSGVHVGGVSKALMHEAGCPVVVIPRGKHHQV